MILPRSRHPFTARWFILRLMYSGARFELLFPRSMVWDAHRSEQALTPTTVMQAHVDSTEIDAPNISVK
jgi:hypothetical protein